MMPPGGRRSTIRAVPGSLSHPIVKMGTWKQGSPSPPGNPVRHPVRPADSLPDSTDRYPTGADDPVNASRPTGNDDPAVAVPVGGADRALPEAA